MTSQEQLNVHLKGASHAMQVKTVEKNTAKALRGAWASWTHPKHSGLYILNQNNINDLMNTKYEGICAALQIEIAALYRFQKAPLLT